MIKLTEIENSIFNELEAIKPELFNVENKPANRKTYLIKKTIGKLGVNLEFKVCTSGFPDEFNSEWLYDIVWYKENDAKYIETVELAFECELHYGIGTIKFDFEKLLLSNANHKVMLCCLGKMDINEIKNYCDKAVKSYANFKKGERVLTLIWDDCYSGEFIPHVSIKD